MDALYFRVGLVVVIVFSVIVRFCYDRRYPITHNTDRRRQKEMLVASLTIFAVLTAQLFGWNFLSVELCWSADVVIRSLGLLLGLVGGIGTIWPRLVRKKTWGDPMAQPTELCTWGPYRYVRHPFYMASLLIVMSIELVAVSLLLFVIVPFLAMRSIDIINQEEERLESVYGQQYADYKRRSWRLIPFIY